MKTRFFYIVALALCFVACENKSPFDTQSPDDDPRILRPYETTTGKLSYYLENDSTPLIDSVTVTPSRYTTVYGYVDDSLVYTGNKINMCFPAGNHSLMIEAVTTAGKRTARYGSITVGGGAIKEDAIVLWEGSKVLKWDENNLKFTKEDMAEVPVGAQIYVEFTVLPSGDPNYYDPDFGGLNEYQLLRVISDWDNDILPEVLMGDKASPYVFTFDQEDKDLLESKGSMSFVGWGLTITKIAYK